MSLTNIVYTPVDTGTAKIRPKGENPNSKDFYLLTGKSALIGLPLRRSILGPVILCIFGLRNSYEKTNIISYWVGMFVTGNR
jgi:hypothetical protein